MAPRIGFRFLRACRVPIALLLAASGCWRATAPEGASEHDSEKARSALIAALDAWKKGDARSLVKRTPPIRLADDDLNAGLLLSDYELEEPDAPVLLHKDVSVILSLRDSRGRSIRREARYQVATAPSLSVLRSDR